MSLASSCHETSRLRSKPLSPVEGSAAVEDAPASQARCNRFSEVEFPRTTNRRKLNFRTRNLFIVGAGELIHRCLPTHRAHLRGFAISLVPPASSGANPRWVLPSSPSTKTSERRRLIPPRWRTSPATRRWGQNRRQRRSRPCSRPAPGRAIASSIVLQAIDRDGGERWRPHLPGVVFNGDRAELQVEAEEVAVSVRGTTTRYALSDGRPLAP